MHQNQHDTHAIKKIRDTKKRKEKKQDTPNFKWQINLI